MIYPVKIEFREYPSGSYVDWSDYLVTAPTVSKVVESDNEGEAGIITFDKASVALRYEAGNAVYNAFSVDLSAKQRYLFRISAPKSNGAYVQLFEGMADFSTIEWPELSNEISFDIIDKLAALGILQILPQREITTLDSRILAQCPGASTVTFYYDTSGSAPYTINELWIRPDTTAYLTSPVIFAGEYLQDPSTMFLDGTTGVPLTPNYLYVINSWIDGVNGNKIQFLTSQVVNEIFYSVGLGYGLCNYVSKNYYGIDILNYDLYSRPYNFEALKIIESMFDQLWPGIALHNLSGAVSLPIPLNYNQQLIDDNPFGTDPLSALKKLAGLMQCYLFINKSGDFVLQAKANLGSNGTSRNIGTTKIYSKTKKYFWDKLVDGVTVNAQSWDVDNNQNYLIGTGKATSQFPGTTSNITPKNPLTQDLIVASNGVLLGGMIATYEAALLAFNNALAIYNTGHDGSLFNIATTTYNTALKLYQSQLNTWAYNIASNVLSFYGLRHAAKDIVLRLDDNTIDWEVLDNLTDTDGIKYFFTKIEFDLAAREVTLSPIVEVAGHSYDIRQLSIGMSEVNSLNLSNSGSISGSSSSSLAPISTVTITDATPQFDRVGIGKPPDDVYQLAILGDGWLTGNLKVDGKIYITGSIDEVDQTNLSIADVTIGLNKGGDNTTAIGGGIILKGLSDSNLATILYDGTQWSLNFGLNIPSATDFKINNVSVLNSTKLGDSVINSSLTKVGTLITGVWNAQKIDATYLNFNATQFADSLGVLTANNFNINGINGLTGTNSITLGGTATISHATASGLIVNGSGSNVIQTLTRDAYGHLTASTTLDVRSLFSKTDPVTYNSSTGVFGLNYNSTHFGVTSTQLSANNITASSTNGMSVTTPFTLGSAIVINTPQDIRSTASPSFVNETLTGVLTSQGTGANTFAGSIGTPVYVSESTGWQITSAGAADFRMLYTDQLHAKAFIADLEQALAGSQIISKSVAKIAADCYIDYSGTLTVESFAGYPNVDVFQSGDRVRLRQFSRSGGGLSITDSWIDVTGTPSYNSDGSKQTWNYSYAAGAMWTYIKAGSLALDYGTSANNWGIIEQTTTDGLWGANSPYWQVKTGNPISAQTVQIRLGNLSGITDVAFGGTLSGFGLYGQNVYLKGKIMITNPADINTSNLTNGAGWTSGATWGSNVTGIPAGLFNFAAPVSGAGLFLDGTHLGFYNSAFTLTNPWRTYMDNSGGFYLSGSGTNSLSWNGSTLSVNGSGTFTGSITASSGAIAGWTIYSNYIRDGQVTLDANAGSIYVTKTDGGFVSLGQTLKSTYTGYYGIAATDSTSNYLFRLDNNANQIAGYDFNTTTLSAGTAQIASSSRVTMSTSSLGSGNAYWSDLLTPKGFSLMTRHYSSSNASMLTMGNFPSNADGSPNGSTFDSGGWYGLQFQGVFSGTYYEYFTLGVRMIDSTIRNRIAGWVFDNSAIYSGTKGTSGTYTTSGITMGSTGFISAPQFRIDTDGSAHYKGALEAATGTFSGSLSAATGTFSGALSAATGTFSGDITSSRFSTSAYWDGTSSGVTIIGQAVMVYGATGYHTQIGNTAVTVLDPSNFLNIYSSSIWINNQKIMDASGYYISGNKIIGTRQSAIGNPTDAGSTTSAVISILNAMRTHGLIST